MISLTLAKYNQRTLPLLKLLATVTDIYHQRLHKCYVNAKSNPIVDIIQNNL